MPLNITFWDSTSIQTREESQILNPARSTVISAERKTSANNAKEVTARKCLTNSVVMALVYFLAFSGFAALRNLESSIDPLAEISLSVLGISAVIGAYLSPLVVYFVGEKGSVIGMWAFMSCLVAANFYPVSYTLFPGAALFGFMAGPGWTAQLSYTTNTAIKYAHLQGKNEEEMVEVSNGIFYLGYSSAQVVGNLVSSLVLHVNSSSHNQSQQSLQCGVNFCPATGSMTSSSATNISQNTLQGLFGIFLSGPVLALLASALLLDPVQLFLTVHHEKESRGCTRWRDELLAPVKLFKDVRMILLVPAIFYSGIEQILMFAGFTEAFVSCAIGVDYVGYIMICWGLCSAVSSFLSGVLARCFGRPLLCLGSLVIGLGLQIYFYFWNTAYTSVAMFFVVSAIWGVEDGILQTQLSALLGLAFKDNHNAAFANFRMLSYFGYAVTYASTAVTCQLTEIYVTSGIIFLSIVSYIAVEIIIRRSEKCHRSQYQSV